MKKTMIVFSAMGILCAMGLSSCGNRQSDKAVDSAISKELHEDSAAVEVVDVTESTSQGSDESYEVSSGYSTDPDYRPTVSDDGDYHTIDGKRRQIQYQGSQEQQRDLDMIDEYMREHPEY